MDVTKILLVLLGGALGTGCRYWLSTFVYSVVEKPSFPYANFIINVSGSFIIGILAELFEARVLISPTVRAALLTGVLGGYTTFPASHLRRSRFCGMAKCGWRSSMLWAVYCLG